jgi:hypothetical protein
LNPKDWGVSTGDSRGVVSATGWEEEWTLSGALENREVISSAHSNSSCVLSTSEGSNAVQGTPALINQLYVSETASSLENELELDIGTVNTDSSCDLV